MTTQKIITLYQYDELSDEAKEKARGWYASLVFSDSSDWDFVYEDASRIGKLLGIDLTQKRVQLIGGGHRYDPSIYFSGFSSQGDGACFEGTYQYEKGSVAKIKKECPNDKELHRIAEQLQEVQKQHFYKLRAKCYHRGHYYHSGCMVVEVWDNSDEYRDLEGDKAEVQQLLRDFADWIYSQLESEYEYRTSDEAVEEAIRVSEYTFDEEGKREG